MRRGDRERLRVALRRALIRWLSLTHLAVYRASGGRLLGRIAGMPVLLLTTTGRTTGRRRTRPLTFVRDGEAIVLVASNGGADRAPGWSLNLQAASRAVVRVGGESFAVEARVATEEERARLWPTITGAYPGYAGYQERTERRIPLMVLTRVG
jgi:deazaflavin-dependent oxidoreductase (nitroreductase family)